MSSPNFNSEQDRHQCLVVCPVTVKDLPPGENMKSFLTVVEGWRPGLVGANWIFLTWPDAESETDGITWAMGMLANGKSRKFGADPRKRCQVFQ